MRELLQGSIQTSHVMFAIFTRELGQVDVRRAKPSHVMFGIVTRDNKTKSLTLKI